MKRITVFLLLIGMLAASLPPLTAFASAEPGDESASQTTTDQEPSAETQDPNPPLTTEPIEPIDPDPPITEEPPVTVDPPETIEPPITTDPPETEDPPVIDYGALLFDELCASIDSAQTLCSISTPEQLDTALLQEVCGRILERVPRFFYLQAIDIAIVTLPSPDADGNLYRYDLRPIYSITPGENLGAAKTYVKEKTDAILEQIPSGLTQMEQALFLHDYLCTNFSYDGTHTVGDLYNLLQSGHGVCRAYVALYAYLLDQIGIANDFAVSPEMNHIWNIIELDGRWYHVDLTRDDPANDHPGRALHTNFLLSDDGIIETGHYDWSAPYVCDSDLYETSLLPDLTGAILFLPNGRYAISKSSHALLKVDFNALAAETVADLTLLRWEVWERPGILYKDQFINLCYDGYLIYLNGPDTIWSYDPASGELKSIIEHHPSAGYLYSLTVEGHTLISHIGKAPGDAPVTVQYATPHRYGDAEGELFTQRYCLLCDHIDHSLTPVQDDFFTALLSHRTAGDGIHDLRLLLLVNKAQLTVSSPLTVTLTLRFADGDRSVTTQLSADDHGLLLIYERAIAGGIEYAPADGYELLGLILRNLDDGSYDAVTLTVSADDAVLYRAELPVEQLFPPPAPDTEEPPSTDVPETDVPATDAPITGEPATDIPVTGELPTTSIPATNTPTTGDAPITAPAVTGASDSDESTEPQ